jgi:hypothetical protein
MTSHKPGGLKADVPQVRPVTFQQSAPETGYRLPEEPMASARGLNGSTPQTSTPRPGTRPSAAKRIRFEGQTIRIDSL